MSEHTLQYQIIQYLLVNKITVIDLDIMSGLQYFKHTDSRRFTFINHHKKMGYIKGQPDFLIILPEKRNVYIEMKIKKRKQSKEQKEFEINIKSKGHEYYVWNSFEDCIKFVKDIKKL